MSVVFLSPGALLRYPHPPPREETSLQADVFPQEWRRTTRHSNTECAVYSRPSTSSLQIATTCDSATLLVYGIHCEPVGEQSTPTQLAGSVHSVFTPSLFSMFHQHVGGGGGARPKKTTGGLFESCARVYRFDNPAQVGCSSAGTFSTFIKNDQVFAFHKAEGSGQTFMFAAAKARAHCTGAFLYVLDTPMEQWSGADFATESAWPVSLGSRVAVFSQAVMQTTLPQQSRHASARALCFGTVVELKAAMAKVQLNWSLADGTPACLYTPRGNLAAVPTAQPTSLCFKFGSSAAAAAALAALRQQQQQPQQQRGDGDSPIELQSCAYAQTMAETATRAEVWLQVGEDQWVCANPRSSSSVPDETTITDPIPTTAAADTAATAEDHLLPSMVFEPSGVLPARVSPLWCGPAVCSDGAALKCAPLRKDQFESRASALYRAAVNIATDFAASSNALAQYPGILRKAWEKANAVPAPSDKEEADPAAQEQTEEEEEERLKTRDAWVESICAELGLPPLADSAPCPFGVDALPEEVFVERCVYICMCCSQSRCRSECFHCRIVAHFLWRDLLRVCLCVLAYYIHDTTRPYDVLTSGS